MKPHQHVLMVFFLTSVGPANFLANAFTSMPIAVTVEGANTLTRSLIIFGQGLTRAHPHLYDMIKTIQAGDQHLEFKQELHKVVGHAFRNTGSSLKLAVTRQRTGASSDPLAYYESQFAKLSANFALCSDLALTLGGKLKFTEMVSGRFADIFRYGVTFGCWIYVDSVLFTSYLSIFTCPIFTCHIQNGILFPSHIISYIYQYSHVIVTFHILSHVLVQNDIQNSYSNIHILSY